MISFLQFLIENAARIAGIKAQPHNQNISQNHDVHGMHLVRLLHKEQNSKTTEPNDVERSHHIIDQLAKHDPTHEMGNKHTEWMVNQYRKGNIRLEDGRRMHTELKTFMQHKDKLANKDINSYKTPADLSSALDQHRDKAVGGLQREEGPGAKLIHKEGHVTVHKLQTKAGACAYGKGTDWCTARDDEDNMFKEYHKDGPLYVVQHHDAGTGKLRKHQIHFESQQVMDEKDRAVDLHHLVKQVPELKNVKEFKGHNSFMGMAFKDPSEHEAHMKNIVKRGSLADIEKVARHVKDKPEYKGVVNTMSVDSNKTVRSLAALVGDDSHHQRLIHDQDGGVRNNTVRASNDQKIIERGAYDKEDHVRASAARKVKDPIIHRVLMRDGKHDVRQNLILNPHLDEKHLETMAGSDAHRWVARRAAEQYHESTGKIPSSYDPGRHNHEAYKSAIGHLNVDYDQAKPGTLKHLRNLHDNMSAFSRESAFELSHKGVIQATAEKHYPGALAAIARAKNPLIGGIGMHDGKGTKHDFRDHYDHAVKQGWMNPVKSLANRE